MPPERSSIKVSDSSFEPHGETLSSTIPAALRSCAADIDRTLDALLPRPEGLHGRVPEAMRYAVFAGGKRLRPFLVLQCAALFGAPHDQALRVAAAIEALHTYSL